MRLLAALLLCASLSATAVHAEPLEAFLAELYAAYGGQARLARVRTVAAHGRIDDFLRKVSGNYARLMRRPGELRIEIRPEQGGEVRILAGERGWQGGGGPLLPAQPLSLASMRYQYAYLDLPMSLADGTATARDGGTVTLEGETLRLLLVETPGAPLLKVWVEPRRHLIRRVAADFDLGPMGKSELGTLYDDYRPVNGLLFPHRLTNLAGGERISQLLLIAIVLDQPLPAQTFAPH